MQIHIEEGNKPTNPDFHNQKTSALTSLTRIPMNPNLSNLNPTAWIEPRQ